MNRYLELIPKKVSHDRASQESKVTSTPRTMSPVVSLSPSISSIANDEVPMEVDSDIGNNETVPSVGGDTSSIDDSVIDTGRRRAQKVKEVKWDKFWAPLQPKNKDGLYFKIMKRPVEVENIATDFINTYSDNNKTGILTILQLFVDLCGYKKLSVAKYYNFTEPNSKEFARKMESQLMDTDLKKTGKFLFMKCSRFETQVVNIVSDFISCMVTASAQSGVLFDDVFTHHVLEFVNCMAFSVNICIRVTGVVLAIKFLTAFVDLYAKSFGSTRDKSTSSEENADDSQKYAIESLIDFLYVIYDKNVLIPDKKCYNIKVKCAQEMFHWIKMFPDIFIFKRRCLGRLVKLVLDHNEIVRRSALATCEALLTCEEIQEQMVQRIELCLKAVSSRFVDTSCTVAVKAVTIFTKALDKYSDYITKEHKQYIINRMFEKNIPLAKVAGKFLAAYLHHRNNDAQQLLLNLVKIAYLKKEFAERLPFFLHSCIESIPELKDWNLIVTTLLDENVPFQTRVHLLHILNETLRFVLTGKFSNVRQGPFEDVALKPEDRLEIVSVIIPKFESLMLEFQTEKMCLKLVNEILMFIKYDVEDPENVKDHYPAIFGLLRELFSVSTDKALLEDITQTFSSFCEKNYQVSNALIQNIKQKYVGALNEDLQQLSPSLDRNLLMRLRETSMKLSILFAKFDLTDLLQWGDIFQVWDKSSFKALKYLLTCCKWYLVWNLRKFIKDSIGENNTPSNPSLYHNCQDFIHCCIDMLRNLSESESFLIFEELCDLYANIEKELRRKRQYSIFLIKIDETSRQDALVNFVAFFVIENTKLHLNERRKYLAKLVNVIYLEVIPVEHFAKILRYYRTHYTEFGAIMDNIINQLSLSNPALPVLIIHTLAQMYEQILDKYQIVNVRSDESKQLTVLAKKFVSLKEMKSSNVLLKMVNMSITFSFRKKENYQFLYFARQFSKLLDKAGKSDAYNLFAEMVPEQDKKDDVLLIFAATLKQGK